MRKSTPHTGKSPRAGDRLPYARLIDQATLALRNGGLMQVIHVGGFGFETADAIDINEKHFGRDMALRSIAQSGVAVYHHVVRAPTHAPARHSFEDPVCNLIEERFKAALQNRPLFENNIFLTLIKEPPKGRSGLARSLAAKLGGGAAGNVGAVQRELRDLDAAREAVMAALSGFRPRLLKGYDRGHGQASELIEFLSALYHGELRPALVPEGDVGLHIPYQRVSFGNDAIQLDGAGGVAGFAGILSFKEYPAQALPVMMDALLRLPFALTISESFAFVDRQIGLERITMGLRRLRAADDDTHTLRRGLSEAKDQLAAGAVVYGEHHLSILVRAQDLSALDQAMAECASAMADFGATPVREQLNLEPAFWAQFPGNAGYIARRGLISSAAFSSFASLHGFAEGDDETHWGEPVAILETTAATPYNFNFHVGDLGHFTVIGPSGSGKTVALNFLIAQAQRFNPRTIVFDKDRGAEIFVRAINGVYADLRPGRPSGFNPLQLPDTPANRSFLRQWIVQLVSPRGATLEPQEEATIARAIEASYDQEPALRRLRYFRELLGGAHRPSAADLGARLAPWVGAGERAWLFDNETDQLDLRERVLGFDVTALLDEPASRTPTLMYLFHRIDERLTGEPTLIVIDEGWKALDDPIFASRLRDWMKTLRKRNAVVGFGTQSARDALDTHISTAIVEQAATQIFMPNSRAQEADYCTGFGLSRHELDVVRSLPAQSRCFLVRQAGASVVVRLDLAGMPDIVRLLSGRESSVRQLDDLRARLGDRPSDWWEAMMGTPYPGPSDAPASPRRLRVVT